MNESLLALLILMAGLLGIVVLIAVVGKPRLDKRHFAKHWQAIEQEQNYMSALIKADSLVDEALRHAHVKGETMGDRLKNSKAILKDINGVWSAHKLRNRIVHETGSQLSAAETQRALSQFKKALKDLGAL